MTAALTVACVRTGTKYGAEHVARLRDGVARNLSLPHRFVCLTDRPARETPPGVQRIEVSGLPGWWAKMKLFAAPLRGDGRWLYLDLDTVVAGDLSPLAAAVMPTGFGICANFARAAGAAQWPCSYGSCVMVLDENWGGFVWERFNLESRRYMASCPKGDQQAVERIVPRSEVTLLQEVLPDGFFLYKKDLPRYADGPPPAAGLVIFGGRSKPETCDVPWVQSAWKMTRRDA